MKNDKINNNWSETITPKKTIFFLNIKEIWEYRDLILMFVKRDFVAVYKQTILGPLWFLIQPIITTLIFTIVFGNMANISTENVPHIVFYLSGITIWYYFSDCITLTSNTFIANQQVFGKVYFPRIVVPISVVISNLLKFTIQMSLFLFFYFYYFITEDSIQPNIILLTFPYLVLLTSVMGLGFGLLTSSLTTKYRDLIFLLRFGIQLWMYATPIIYPLSTVPEKYRIYALLNPLTAVVETFKFGFLGHGTFKWEYLLISSVVTFLVFILGVLLFNKTEQNFMDTV